MAIKQYIDNPFILGYNIPNEYFCDRVSETDKIVELLQNGNNVVLMSERRIGKSSLLAHVLKDKRITKNYTTLYVDIFKTEKAEHFAEALAGAIVDAGLKFPKTLSQNLQELISRISIDYGHDVFDKPTLGAHITPSTIKTNYGKTVEELLKFLNKSDKKTIVVFDEFQQIKTYPEKRFDALLRTYVQATNKVKFVFSGSERRMLRHMFGSSTEPFYRSATDMELYRIPKETYMDYVSSMFRKFKKRIDDNATSQLYDLFSGYTSYMSQVLNKAFYLTKEGGLCNQDVILKALSENLVGAENGYYDKYFQLNPAKRSFIRGLAVSRGVLHITGERFLNNFGLSPTQAEECAKVLQGKKLSDRYIYRDPRTGVYYVDDKFFEVWIRVKENISLKSQLEQAHKYVKRDPRENMRRNFPQPYALTTEQNNELARQGFLSEPIEFTDVDLSVTRYVVQKDTNGDTISLPVEDCLRLLGGIDFITANKKQHALSDEEKKILSEGKPLNIEGQQFRFDLKNCTVKRKYIKRTERLTQSQKR